MVSKIQLLILDVDGTMTDGGIYYDENGNELKKFNAKDGLGIVKIQKAGVSVMILSGRKSKIVERRAAELGVAYLIQGEKDKAGFLKQFFSANKFPAGSAAYIGDDLNDLEAMKLVGHTACPADAVGEIRNFVSLKLTQNGGCGAVREYIDFLLK